VAACGGGVLAMAIVGIVEMELTYVATMAFCCSIDQVVLQQ